MFVALLLSGSVEISWSYDLIPCKTLLEISVKNRSFPNHRILSVCAVQQKGEQSPLLGIKTGTDRFPRQRSTGTVRLIQQTDRDHRRHRESEEENLRLGSLDWHQEGCFGSLLNATGRSGFIISAYGSMHIDRILVPHVRHQIKSVHLSFFFARNASKTIGPGSYLMTIRQACRSPHRWWSANRKAEARKSDGRSPSRPVLTVSNPSIR